MKLSKQLLYDWIFVVILYTSTLYGFTNSILIALLIPILLSCRISLTQKETFFILSLSAISLFSILNNILFGLPNASGSTQFYVPLLVLSFLAAKFINHRVLKIVLLIVLVEVLLALLQNALGVSTFFRSNPNFYEFSSLDLYYRRSAGLSSSASILSYKIMISFVILFVLKPNIKYSGLVSLLLVAGLLVTFNRSAILASLVFYFLVSAEKLLSGNFNKYKVVLGILGFFVIFAITPAFDFITQQFNRGKVDTVVDLSLRDVLWVEYFHFISENLLFGSGSFKLLLEAPVQGYLGVMLHAHNSYIMFLASNGLLLSFIFLVLVILNINSRNYKLIAPLLVYSITQYGILWGVSFMDVMFLYFLTAGARAYGYRNSV